MSSSKLMVATVLLVAACESSGRSTGDGQSQAGAVDAGDGSSAADTARSVDGGGDAGGDAGCEQLVWPADGLHEDDECWAPPAHYCSNGWGWGSSAYCAPGGELCCLFWSGCAPCGWVGCEDCETGEQPFVDGPECEEHTAYLARLDEPVCLDGGAGGDSY